MTYDDDRTYIGDDTDSFEEVNQIASPRGAWFKTMLRYSVVVIGAVGLGLALTFLVIKPFAMSSDDNSESAVQVVQTSPSNPVTASVPMEYQQPRPQETIKPAVVTQPQPPIVQYEEVERQPDNNYGFYGSHPSNNVYTVNDIIVNPAGTYGRRFLAASFGFELTSPKMFSQFEANEALIKDALITILSSKTVAQLTDPKERELIRYQIKNRVQKILAGHDVGGVYYTDFVLQ